MIGVVVVSVVALLYAAAQEYVNRRERSALASRFAAERIEWARERRELLNRIQRPEILVPLTPNEGPPSAAAEETPGVRDEIDLVGKIVDSADRLDPEDRK